MLSWRSRIGASLVLFSMSLAACQSQTQTEGEPKAAAKASGKVVELKGIDTSKLTNREKKDWSKLVSELLAPCSDQPVSLAQCVMESRDCSACEPAADFLVKQVTRGKTRSQAEKAYRLRFAPEEVKSIDLGGSPSKGPDSARVTVVEFADFECPFCGMAAPLVDAVVKKYPKDVKLVFKHFPLGGHEHAEPASRAAVAAGMQGKFWEMHHQLFTHQQELDDQGLATHAKDVGLDVKKFEEDRKSEAAADQVSADRRQGSTLGLQGTPSLYINGRAFDLELFDLKEDLEDWIQLEIQLVQGSKKGAGKDVPAKAPASAAPAGSGGAQANAPKKGG